MLVVAVELVLAPALVAGASLAGRRWGPGASRWIAAIIAGRTSTHIPP